VNKLTSLTILSVNIEGYLTADETAALLGIERRSLYHYVRRLEGFPQPVKIGRTLLFKEDEITDWRKRHPTRRRGDPPPD
jgi:predicted DNA-binding transcriptional regulator AlpA